MNAGNMQSTRFVPALNRPATTVRWGVGLQVTGNVSEGDLKPIGSKQTMPSGRNSRRNNRGGGGGDLGGADVGGADVGGLDLGTGGLGGTDLGGADAGGLDLGTGGLGGTGGGFNNRGGGGPQVFKVPDRIKNTTGELGEKIYERLVEEVQSGAFGDVLKDAASQGASQGRGQGGGNFGSDPGGAGGAGAGGRGGRAAARGPAGITMLAEGSTGKIVADARAKKVDVILMFNVKVSRNPRTKLVTNDVTTVLIDPTTGSRLPVPRLVKLSNMAVQKAREDEKKKDPVESNLIALFAYISENIALQPSVPETVTREERIDRVREILADENRDTLPALAEIAFYRHAQLFGDVEVESAFSKILDPERGAKLATGSTDDRTAVLKGLLPKVPAAIWNGGGGASGDGEGKSGGLFGRLFGGRSEKATESNKD
jgi:hypothetical protein